MSLTFVLQMRGVFGGHRDPLLVLASEHDAMVEDLTADRDHWKANHESLRKRARLLRERLDMPVERVQVFDQVLLLQQEVASLVQTVNELSEARTALEIENTALDAQLVEARAAAQHNAHTAEQLSQTVATLQSQVSTLQAQPESYQTGYHEGRRIGSRASQQEYRSLKMRHGELQKHAESLEMFLENSDKYARTLEVRILNTADIIKQALNAKFAMWHQLLEEALRIAYSPAKENPVWTHKTHGGAYTLLGESCGAGTCRGQHLMVYRDTRSGKLYHRSSVDFGVSMIDSTPVAQEQAA